VKTSRREIADALIGQYAEVRDDPDLREQVKKLDKDIKDLEDKLGRFKRDVPRD
jgi:hypothetical protein